jgi:hypothetical protein
MKEINIVAKGKDSKPDVDQDVREKAPAEVASARVPKISARKAGKVGQVMEGLAAAYEQKYPDRKVRWVYSPLHRGELSNVMTRRAQGYSPVLAEDLGSLDGFDPSDQVRVGDCILMSITAEERKEIEAEIKSRADEQARSVESEYYHTVGSLDSREAGQPRMRPSGRAVIEERDREFEIHQRKED